jgi:CheY-like chemotaxis protein
MLSEDSRPRSPVPRQISRLAPRQGEPGAHSGHPSVLIADDEEALSELLARELSALGYECVSLRSKADAFRWSVRHHPDIIITDIRSPEMDGFQFLSLLKSDVRTRTVPIVFWTGVASPDNAALAKRLGAAEVVSKPCRLADVQEVIERLLRNGHAPARRQTDAPQ